MSCCWVCCCCRDSRFELDDDDEELEIVDDAETVGLGDACWLRSFKDELNDAKENSYSLSFITFLICIVKIAKYGSITKNLIIEINFKFN